MNAIQIVRDSVQFPEVKRINENQVIFYFDHSSRPYGDGTQYMAMMVTVDTQSDDIEEIKSLALPDIKEYRIKQISDYDVSDNVNCFYIGGNPMWLTVEEREQLATQINANEAIGRESMSKWFGGHELAFPISAWKQMLVAVEIYAGDALNVTEGHKSDIDAMEDADDVIAYDITKGYPEKLVFPYVQEETNEEEEA